MTSNATPLEKQARRIAENQTMDLDDAYVRGVHQLAQAFLRQRELLREGILLADGGTNEAKNRRCDAFVAKALQELGR